MMRVRLDRALQSPARTLAEEVEFEFGPRPEPTRPTGSRSLEPRRAWDARDVVENEARHLLAALAHSRDAEAPDPTSQADDFLAIALRSLTDSLLALGAEKRRLAPQKRTSQQAAALYAEVQDARKRLVKVALDLLAGRVEP